MRVKALAPRRHCGNEIPGTLPCIDGFRRMTDPQARTVPLVEDEVFVRIVAADALSDSGFSVFEAGTAQEALDILAGNNQIAVLFTDINMPGEIDGLQLAKLVGSIRPEIKVILTSGRQWVEPSCLPDDGVFLAKPHRAQEMCDTVQAQMDKATD